MIGVLTLIMVAQMAPMTAFAGTVETGLDFLGKTSTITGDGYEWNGTTKTLKVTDLTINADSGNGLGLPDGAIIELNGDLTINSKDDAIYCWGAVTINGNGNLNLTSEEENAINVRKLTIDMQGDINIESCNGTAFNTYVDSEINVDGTIYMNSDWSFFCWDDSVLTIKGNTKITMVGCENLYADTIILKDAVTFTDNFVVLYVDSSYTIEDTVTFNGMVYLDKDNYNEDTNIIYGDYVATHASEFDLKKLEFKPGASLTVNEGLIIDLSDYNSIDFTNWNVVNKGIIILPSNTDIANVSFTGTGIIVVGDAAYYEDGTKIVCSVELDFTDSETPSSGNGYIWDEATKTLTITQEGSLIYSGDYGIELPEDSTIVLEGDLTIFSCDDCIYSKGSITIEGTGNLRLTALNGCGIYADEDGDVTIEGLGSVTINSDDECIEANEDGTKGKIFLDNIEKITFVSEFNECLDGEEGIFITNVGELIATSNDDDCIYSANGSIEIRSVKNINITSDSDGIYADDGNILLENINNLSITAESDCIDANRDDDLDESKGNIYLMNIVARTLIPGTGSGEKELEGNAIIITYDITLTQTGEGVISPSDTTVTVSEGENQEFTFTPAEGYEITSVIVDGEDWGNVTSFIFEEVTTIHSLDVFFSVIESDMEDDTDTEAGPSTEDDTNTEATTAVETGDTTNIFIWGMIMSVGLLGITLFIYDKRKVK